jgi:hypothetical protein
MRRFFLYATAAVSIIVLGTQPNVFAADNSSWRTGDCGDHWNTQSHWGTHPRACELRRTTFSLNSGHLAVAGKNGGIEVIGEDRNDVAVEARVEAWAGSEADANGLLHQVQIETSGDQLRDQGPESHDHTGYSVSYRIRVPRLTGMDARTMNGGIALSHLEGEIVFDTTNGGVELNDLAGNVHGRTVNGGLDIHLTGDQWKGEGLRAQTTNGGVELSIPQNYNAHLEAGTVNGGFSVDFPITVQGTIKNHLSTDIGRGGSVVQAETTNGGIEVHRS